MKIKHIMTIYKKIRWHVEKTYSYACRTINAKLKLPHLIILKHKTNRFPTKWDKDASTIQSGTTGHVYCTLPTSVSAPEGTLGGIIKSHHPSVRYKSYVSHNSKTDKGNLIKLHRKIKQNEKLCRAETLGSHDQGQGHN